jgi:hypothetical protein
MGATAAWLSIRSVSHAELPHAVGIAGPLSILQEELRALALSEKPTECTVIFLLVVLIGLATS